MNNKDEDYIIEESTENNKEKKANNSVVIMSICFGLFLFGLISLLFLSPKKSTPTADIEHKVERAKPVNTFIALKIPPKIPVFKTGERFKFSISREIYFSGNMKDVTLQIKVPENVANRQKIYNLEIIPKEQKFVDKSDGKYAHIFIPNPQGKITVTIKGEASVRTYTLEIAEKIKKNIDGFLNNEDKQYYLKETGGLDVNSRLLQLTARDEIQTATNDVDTVKNIFDYVVEQMRYDTNEINKDKGALKALQSRRGVCEEFTDLFVTFCRIKGIPARVQAGFDLPFKDDMKDEYSGHTWAEVYFPEYGWVTFDPTNSMTDVFRRKMNQLQITPYDTLSELTKYRTYLILDSKMISVKYDGEGSIASKNLRILYSKI